MKLILGLGNPGSAYSHTRHNAGFDAVECAAAFFQKELKKRCLCYYRYAKVPGGILVQPLTYMNNSGKVLKYFRRFKLKPEDIMVVCDNMDLGVGGMKIKKGGGTGGQRGLDSICSALGSSDIFKLYIGTGRPAEGVPVNKHVLAVETDPGKKECYEKTLQDAGRAIRDFIAGADIAKLQTEYNRKALF